MKHPIPAFAFLAFTLLGCGKEAPAPAPVAPPAGPTVPKAVVYELDASKHDIPAQPVSGRIAGKPFTPDRVELDGNILTFRQGTALNPDTQLMVVVPSAIPSDKDFKAVTRAEQKAGEGIPNISVTTLPAGGTLSIANIPEGYALTLELGQPSQGKVNGRIQLSLPGAEKNVIAGTFTALHDRSAVESPSPADKPYITGAIDHKGTEGTTLIVGYVRMPAAGQDAIYDKMEASIQAGPIGAVRSYAYKPRTVTIRPNEGGTGTEYDLTKLPPGKYLVAARLDGGIPAWFVREVTADSAFTVPVTLKTEVAGHVEVEVPGLPADASVQVQVLPAEVAADDPSGQYEAHAGLILGTWANLEKGKAQIRQLPAGEYVVSARAVDVRYNAKVTVKAGETARVELKVSE